jgi:hypothetical protein
LIGVFKGPDVPFQVDHFVTDYLGLERSGPTTYMPHTDGREYAIDELIYPSADRLHEIAYGVMPYEDYLQQPEWHFRQQVARWLADYRCQVCGGTNQLNVHHRSDPYPPRGTESFSELTVLCRDCHKHNHFHPDSPFRRMRGSN